MPGPLDVTGNMAPTSSFAYVAKTAFIRYEVLIVLSINNKFRWQLLLRHAMSLSKQLLCAI